MKSNPEAFKTLMEAMGYKNVTYTVKKAPKTVKKSNNKTKENKNVKKT